ncbi:hypothetical protein NPIL_2101 [Nephila pilipes]|uniref:Uncharacterized protein n=1 Tax=Nephila pilipes TaxID=299642 RepID=A0A8X6Q819_NEPPI|nr:hypothetical protein NPIL_2101 [Nephila pilipes]
MFGCPIKLRLANSVLLRNLISNMTTEEDLERIIDINKEWMVNIDNRRFYVISLIEDKGTNLESTVDLESQDNNNVCEKESRITMKLDTEVQT